MDLGEDLLRWTARLALLAGTGSFACRSPWRGRRLWMAGWALMLAHLVVAFQVRHFWSHDAAARHTAERTFAEVGAATSFGLWLNYLFAALWTVDVLIGMPAALRRPWRWFWWFMAVNGAIVFAPSPSRWFAAAALIALIAVRSRPQQGPPRAAAGIEHKDETDGRA